MEKKRGYVYILTNPLFKEDWIKIEKTDKDTKIRSKQLYTTGVPLPYEVYATLETDNHDDVEKLIFNIIELFDPGFKINKKREFINMYPDKAYELFKYIKQLLGDQAILELNGDNVEAEFDSDNEKC